MSETRRHAAIFPHMAAVLLACLATFGCSKLTSLSSNIQGVTGEDWPQAFQRALAHFHKSECAEGWQIVWPIAASGNFDAMLFLAETMRQGLYPPRGKDSGNKLEELHWVSIYTYATLSPSKFHLKYGNIAFFETPVRSLLVGMLRHYRPDENGRQVAECFRSWEDAAVCQKLAISLGVVRELSSYVREADALAHRGAEPARCPYLINADSDVPGNPR